MSIAKGIFSIQCKNCGAQHDFTAEESDFECTGGDERGMGTENIYTWEFEFNCDCGQEIEVEYQAVEYPVEAYNYDDVDVKGASKQVGYTFDFHEEFDDGDF